MGVTIKGLSAVMANMSRTEGRVMKGSLQGLRQAAKVVVRTAQEFAPIDEGTLVQAIKAQEVRQRTALGQFGQINIQVGVDQAALNLEDHGGFDYSVKMHEDPSYNLGPKSLAKQNASGKQVGYKYLERALKQSQREVQTIMENAIKRSIR